MENFSYIQIGFLILFLWVLEQRVSLIQVEWRITYKKV